MLNSPNEGLLSAVTRHFSLVLKKPELAPDYRNVSGNAVWTNREASVAAIRARFELPDAAPVDR